MGAGISKDICSLGSYVVDTFWDGGCAVGVVGKLGLTERRAKMATLDALDQPKDDVCAECELQRGYRTMRG